uniref:Glycosyltransferase 61 catalytic domain-containing protein n=1 Tax=Oryza punctata TaxID=4537 RepID=A0A0E0LAX4_ORYPU
MKGRHERIKKGWSGSAAAAVWLLLLPLFVLIVLKTDFLPQVARLGDTSFTKVADEMVQKVSSLGLDTARWQQQQTLDVAKLEDSVVGTRDELTGHVDANKDSNQPNQQILAMSGSKDSRLINSDVAAAAKTSHLSCNFSSAHMDTCAMEGDIRIHGRSGVVYVVASLDYRPENATVVIRPYPRKWEQATMERVRQITIRSTAPPGAASTDDDGGIIPLRCTVARDMPAVVFSTGGYSVNFFHTMNDILLPLYITAREYGAHVQLLAANYDRRWTAKYQHVLAALSMYPVVDLDADAAVRCFPSARVGVESHRVLGIDTPLTGHNGYTMVGFLDFLRSAYSLPRHAVQYSPRRPRVVMVLRRKSRALTNEAEVVAAVTEVGFEVVAAGPEDAGDVARFAETVNSCDVMVGVHGAGLTNMVFLPRNGTVVQIIPWGGMKWPCWYDYGEPVPAMGLRYVEYEVTANETTLRERYPMDHPVFTDPVSIHRKGFNHLWSTFLNGQNITLDINRFKAVMEEVYTSVMAVA